MDHLLEKLRSDFLQATKDLSDLDLRRAVLAARVEYIGSLLGSASAPERDSKTLAAQSNDRKAQQRASYSTRLINELKLADVAFGIVLERDDGMSGTEIAERAIELGYGFGELTAERARSHFSAIVSKEQQDPQSRFWQMGRGRIGLAHWKDREPESLGKHRNSISFWEYADGVKHERG